MNTLQTWFLLRPLIVFVMAGPAFVFATLSVLRKQPPKTERCVEARADGSLRFVLAAGGVWHIQPDCRSQSRTSNNAAPGAQKGTA